jgi:hypothetical protein
LYKKNITLDPLCPICNLEIETLGHALWTCNVAKDVWIECSSKIHKCTSDEEDFIRLVERLMARLDENQMHLVATVARQIWLRRNSVVFEGDFLNPASLMRRAQARVEACLQAANKREVREVQSSSLACVNWTKPDWGRVKVNWDTAVDNVRGRAGIGVIIRDHEGDIIVMMCANKRYATNSLLAEALVVWQASDLVKQLDLHRVTLEKDALSIVQAMEKKGDCWNEFGQDV